MGLIRKKRVFRKGMFVLGGFLVANYFKADYNVGALIVGIGLGGILYYSCYKEPPKTLF